MQANAVPAVRNPYDNYPKHSFNGAALKYILTLPQNFSNDQAFQFLNTIRGCMARWGNEVQILAHVLTPFDNDEKIVRILNRFIANNEDCTYRKVDAFANPFHFLMASPPAPVHQSNSFRKKLNEITQDPVIQVRMQGEEIYCLDSKSILCLVDSVVNFNGSDIKLSYPPELKEKYLLSLVKKNPTTPSILEMLCAVQAVDIRVKLN